MSNAKAHTSPTTDTELDTLLWHVQQAAFDQEGLADSSIAEIKAELKALIERENLRVTLELMEKHHIPLQTHTLDTELDTILDQAVKPKLKQDVLNLLENADMNGYKRGYKEADNLVAFIEQYKANAVRAARIDELETLRGIKLYAGDYIADRLAALTSPPERKD